MIVPASPKMDKMSALVFHDNIIASPACYSLSIHAGCVAVSEQQ
jgi:hypothetical protein